MAQVKDDAKMPPAFDARRDILSTVGRYYTEKVTTHGATPQGVDWRDKAGQENRFEQLLRAFDLARPFTLSEVGCGYGALAHYLQRMGHPYTYAGFDISPEMIAEARACSEETPNASFEVGTCTQQADYVVASGIFNVRFEFDDALWSAYVFETMDQMVGLAQRGAAFNFLTGLSDAHRKEARLWYPDPGEMLSLCLSRYGRRVALYHDYPLYEFTVAVSCVETKA